MKVFLFVVCMPLLCVLLGTGALGALYGRQSRKLHRTDRLIMGFVVILGMAEAAHLAALFMGRSLSEAVLLFAVGTAALSLVSLGVWLWSGRNAGSAGARGTGRRAGAVKPRGMGHASGFSGADCTLLLAGLFLVFGILVIYQIVILMSGDYVYRTGDMTAETVQSFLETDGVYRVNPLTGRPYEGGVPLRIQILGLPTLYAILCRISGLSVRELVWRLVPLFTLLLCYSAFWRLARALFTEDRDRERRLLFMVCVAAVFCVGDYLYGMDGFGLLYNGFGGAAIRNLVLMPYVFGLALRHRWRLTVPCILAEACIVWTLYGMGACVLATSGMGALRIWQKRRARAFHEAGGEAR